ncbi:hypothetical protein F5X98DRAFT_383752 [Xylaria grammica]|nr:hypothetical protein F5X98DRAFT_383752 [Xylaria grammica]
MLTRDNINHLLDLRQKDADLSEAIWTRISAENTARQGRTILVFTVVTIVFLPITFLSSLFALNIESFPHDANGTLSYSPQWAFSRLLGVTIAVSVPLILLAFFMNEISDFILSFFSARADGQKKRKDVGSRDEKSDVMTAAVSSGPDKEQRKKWRDRVLSRRWKSRDTREHESQV